MYPVNPEAEEIIASIPDGVECMGIFKPARNMRQHHLLFAMLSLLVHNTNLFEDIEQAKTALKLATHEVDIVVDEGGKIFYILRSMAAESMPQDKFDRFFKRAVHVIITRWLHGMTESELCREIEEMVDGPRAIGHRV